MPYTMTENDPTRENEYDSDVRQALNNEWLEQENLQVSMLGDGEDASQSPGELKVLKPESDDESAVVLSAQSENTDSVARLSVDSAFILAEQLKLVAEQMSSRENIDL